MQPLPNTGLFRVLSDADVKTVSGAKVLLRQASETDVLTLMQQQSLSEIVARLLVVRGIRSDSAADFLCPTLKVLMPDPLHFLDMEAAVEAAVAAIERADMIAVLGDYDVDGATSSALLHRFFSLIQVPVKLYIPDRIKEGYGPNPRALEYLQAQGAGLCITVDCGTMSHEALAHAEQINLDMVVLDHHIGGDVLPPAKAIVNPNRLDDTSPHTHLAAVGMTFLYVVALTKRLEAKGYFKERLRPDLLQLLDLVALGTVCDVVPLTGINRAFVNQGLKVLHRRRNLGLRALADVAGIDEKPSSYHLGYVLGPRINAGGRVGESSLGAELLSTSDENRAITIAKQLNHYNAERQAIEAMVLEEAMQQAESLGEQDVYVLVGKGWHAGVIGIVAGRIKEAFHRPVAVIGLEDGVGKASARSIAGIDFGAAVIAAKQKGILSAGGGHAMAAGFTIEEARIEEFRTFLQERFARAVAEHGQRVVKVDAVIRLSAIDEALIEDIDQVAPFGMGNAEPKFLITDVRIARVDVLKGKHLRCIVSSTQMSGSSQSVKAMAFNEVGTPLGDSLQQGYGHTLALIAKVKLNQWQGKQSVQLIIEDVLESFVV